MERGISTGAILLIVGLLLGACVSAQGGQKEARMCDQHGNISRSCLQNVCLGRVAGGVQQRTASQMLLLGCCTGQLTALTALQALHVQPYQTAPTAPPTLLGSSFAASVRQVKAWRHSFFSDASPAPAKCTNGEYCVLCRPRPAVSVPACPADAPCPFTSSGFYLAPPPSAVLVPPPPCRPCGLEGCAGVGCSQAGNWVPLPGRESKAGKGALGLPPTRAGQSLPACACPSPFHTRRVHRLPQDQPALHGRQALHPLQPPVCAGDKRHLRPKRAGEAATPDGHAPAHDNNKEGRHILLLLARSPAGPRTSRQPCLPVPPLPTWPP